MDSITPNFLDSIKGLDVSSLVTLAIPSMYCI